METLTDSGTLRITTLPKASLTLAILPVALALCTVTACSRPKHFQRADRAAHHVLAEKSAGTPWQPPPGFTVLPDSRSRFYDPTHVVDPRLPSPAPVLYGYAMPELATLSAIERSVESESDLGPVSLQDSSTEAATRVLPLEPGAWSPLPESCLRRMLEFESVRSEYGRTFPQETIATEDEEERLHLPAIVELALINSREYQTRKELLYQVALRLTLERYAYELQFLTRGNGFDIDYSHVRNQGATVNTLAIPSAIGVQKVTRRGADVLARFANDIVLTFNGPTGFSSQIGSELLFQLSQSVLQRDVIFESLTQAERDVVYAARDFARFRKEFFVGFARDYYSLLLDYRSIEINAFDYFSNQREFRKGQATFRTSGRVSRIQVDQFEQNALRSRSNLVSSCNTLERSLDNLKLRIGIPPEMPLDIDLSELEDLTRRDSRAATFEQAGRNRRNLEREWRVPRQDPSVALNSAKLYTDNLYQGIRLQQQARRHSAIASLTGGANSGREDTAQARTTLTGLWMRFESIEGLVDVAKSYRELQDDLMAESPDPVRLFQGRIKLAAAMLEARRRLSREAGQQDGDTGMQLEQAEDRIEQLFDERDKAIERAVQELDVEALDGLLTKSLELLEDIGELTAIDPSTVEVKALRDALAPHIIELLAVGEALEESREILPVVEIAMDDAMLTATTQRLELANAREQLADAWRQIKLRGDDLRAIVNWSFRHAIRTPGNYNRPFSFTFDESDTRLSFSFDAPLNRFQERNAFRVALISYNRELRSLIQSEDEIKLDVRNDIRNLQLDRNQYDIAVASAALAAERVNSTRLRLDQGSGTARDFLEAQQAFTTSLNAVAREHIGFLVDRMQLFLDLEQMQVDELGYWQNLYNEDVQPAVRLEMPQYGASIYGDLPCVKYSARVRRMLHVPAGQPRIELPEELAPILLPEDIEAIQGETAPPGRPRSGSDASEPTPPAQPAPELPAPQGR